GQIEQQTGPEGLQQILDHLPPEVRGSTYERFKSKADDPYFNASEGPGVEQPAATEETPNAPGRRPPGAAGGPPTPDLTRASDDAQLKAFERRTGAATEHLTPDELANRRRDVLARLQDKFS